ncbi:MAG: hypothetical protein IKS66_02385 [Oscillospiraceae bacterium]|nr:hypothetical protein [Oscillospiraceae bacterium]
MKATKRLLALLFFLLALGMAALAGLAIRAAGTGAPEIPDGEPTALLERFFSALKQRDLPAASLCLSGGGSLGLEDVPTDPVAALLWEAEKAVWDFAVLPGNALEGALLCKTVRVRCLDADALTARIGTGVETRLAAAVEAADTEEEIYTADGAYRPELLDRALLEAAAEAAADPGDCTVYRELTVRLELDRGQWRIVADSALLGALTGGAAG